MTSVILLNRYLLIISGLLIFAISFLMANDTNKKRVISLCCIILIMSIFSNIFSIVENYNKENKLLVSYMQNEIKENDIILYSNAINGAVVTTQISSYVPNISYFYNKENWNVYEAYKAFSPYMKIKNTLPEILDTFTGRIWLIENGNTYTLLEEIESLYSIKKIDSKQFNQPYKNYSYTVELIEKY